MLGPGHRAVVERYADSASRRRSQPLHVLGRVADDPVGAWRRGDQDAIRRLAGLEPATHGIVSRMERDR